MKQIITTVLIAIISFAGPHSHAQDLYRHFNHDSKTLAYISRDQYHQQNTLNQLTAQYAVLTDRYRHDAAFHLGRLACVREHMLYNDALALQVKQQALDHTRELLREYNDYLKNY